MNNFCTFLVVNNFLQWVLFELYSILPNPKVWVFISYLCNQGNLFFELLKVNGKLIDNYSLNFSAWMMKGKHKGGNFYASAFCIFLDF